MVDGNNTGRLGAGFISVCLQIRWLGHFGGFYVPEPPCRRPGESRWLRAEVCCVTVAFSSLVVMCFMDYLAARSGSLGRFSNQKPSPRTLNQ